MNHFIHALERRRFLAADFWTLQDGRLTVEGTDGNDTLTVESYTGHTTNETLYLGISLNEQEHTFLWEFEPIDRVELRGGGGDDHLDFAGLEFVLSTMVGDGGDGDDRLVGGLAEDDLFGGDGNDRFVAGDGNDTIRGWNGDDTIDAGTGDDVVLGGDGLEKIAGGDGDDTLSGGAQKDTLDGGLGNDRLNGNGGHDRLYGYAGADRLYGYDGNDWLDGGSSNDRLEGGGGLDSMFGQGGNDRFFAADAEIDQLFGGKDDDTAVVDAADILSSVTTV